MQHRSDRRLKGLPRYKARLRNGGGTSQVTIQGKLYSKHIVKLRWVCMNCLSGFRFRNAGLVCSYNQDHYGFILKSEAEAITQQERFMKLGEMFKSEYFRGIDLPQPLKLTVDRVTDEKVKDWQTGKYVMEYCLVFKEDERKKRIGKKEAEGLCKPLNINPLRDEFDVAMRGKVITLYANWENNFGKESWVARSRGVQRGDKFPGETNAPPAQPQPEPVSPALAFVNGLKSLYADIGIPEVETHNEIARFIKEGIPDAKYSKEAEPDIENYMKTWATDRLKPAKETADEIQF